MSDIKDDLQFRLPMMVTRCPIGVYVHCKGGTYVVHGHSLEEASLVALVHYYSVDKGTRWTRTIDNFTEVFDGRQRFVRIDDVTDEMLARARGARGE
jgi:hypothetical protein